MAMQQSLVAFDPANDLGDDGDLTLCSYFVHNATAHIDRTTRGPVFMRFLTLLAIIAWLSSGDVYARCDDEHAIWETASDGVRHTLAIKSDDQVFGFIARIEEWRNGKLAWRLQAEIGCSNGAVTCRLDIPNMVDPDDPNKDEQDHSTVVVERIDADGDGNSEWIVLAGLEQDLYYSGGANVEFLNRFCREDEHERILIPNVYRFADCRDASDASKSGEPDPGQQIAGALFGIPQLCAAYKRYGALIPDIKGEQPPSISTLASGGWTTNDWSVCSMTAQSTKRTRPEQLTCGAMVGTSNGRKVARIPEPTAFGASAMSS